MTTDEFRVWLHPNPPLGVEPDEDVWRDVGVDGSFRNGPLFDRATSHRRRRYGVVPETVGVGGHHEQTGRIDDVPDHECGELLVVRVPSVCTDTY